MEYLSSAVTQLTIMFIMIGVGFCARKLKLFAADGTKAFNAIVVNIFLPCMIIGSVFDVDYEAVWPLIGPTFALAFAQFCLLILVAVVLCKILRVEPRHQSLYIFMSLCTNTGFVCMPVLQSVYGNIAVVLSSLYILMCNLFISSIGLALLESAQQGRSGFKNIRITAKTLQNAPLIACLIALFFLFTQVQLPNVLQDTVQLGSRCAVPIAMVIVGAVLADSDLKHVFLNVRIWGYVLIRMLIVPAALCLLLAPLVTDQVTLAVFVVMFAAPVGAMVPAFAGQYDQDTELAASATVCSTLSCYAIFPALMALVAAV